MVTFKIALIFYEWRSVMFSVEQILLLSHFYGSLPSFFAMAILSQIQDQQDWNQIIFLFVKFEQHICS